MILLATWIDLFINVPPWFWWMIILDAIIAVIIPPYMTWRRAISKRDDIADQFGIPIAKKIYDYFKPRMKEDADGLLQDLKNSIKTEVNTNITNILQNDIPHAIQKEVDPFRVKFESLEEALPSKKELMDLSSAFKGFVTASGILEKANKKIEMQAMEQMLMENYPEKYKSYGFLKFLHSQGALTKGELNKAFQFMIKQIQMEEMTQGGIQNGKVPEMSMDGISETVSKALGVQTLQKEENGRKEESVQSSRIRQEAKEVTEDKGDVNHGENKESGNSKPDDPGKGSR